MDVINIDLINLINYSKYNVKVWRFFKAAIFITMSLSYKNLSKQGNKSNSVYLGPKILASSCVLAANVFLILAS